LIKDADALFMAAAPADFRPKTTAKTKRPRGDGAMTLELEATPDVLKSLKRPKGCLVVGFALETGNGLARARQKLQDKSLDFVVLNDALEPGAGFEVTTNRVTVLSKGGRQLDLPLLPKRDVADRILDAVEEAL
jgi:phosphopantothenoylcysteine decarboxylase/phosphopantothenate--cysteine ligase